MDTMDCPKCNGRLQSVKLDIRTENKYKDLQGADLEYELEVDQCFVCGGTWFDKGKLENYLREGLTTLHSDSMGKEMDQKLNIKKGKCPVCQLEMLQQPYPLDKNVQVDVCGKCGGIWLDSTEIDRLESEEWKLQPAQSLFNVVINALRRPRGNSDSS